MKKPESEICTGYPFCLNFNKPNGQDVNNKFIIRNKNKKEIILCRELKYCKAEGQYTHLFLINRKILISKSIGEIGIILSNCFFRVHNSYIVNLHFVDKIIRSEKQIQLLINDVLLPVAYRKRKDTLVKIEKICTYL